MPNKSKAERKAASRMTWTEIIKHVREVEQCDEREARRQIGNAVADRELHVWWEDQREIPFGSTGGIGVQISVPPRDAAYWLTCEIDLIDPDRVLEPPPYDPDWVDKRTAKRLDKQRRYRKPIFKRDQVLEHWPIERVSQVQSDNVVGFLKASSPGRPGGRPTARDQVYDALRKMREEGYDMKRPQKTLAQEAAKRSGTRLGEANWDERTTIDHVSTWLRDNGLR
jgi:hypothetical protein